MAPKQSDRPPYCTEKHLEYLNTLRSTGVVNMYSSGAWLERAFPKLAKWQVDGIILYYMSSHQRRHEPRRS